MKCEKCKNQIKQYRSLQQNRALHLYFTLLADELNLKGIEFKKFIRVDIPWSGIMIKEILWKPLQKVYLKEKSTTKLTTKSMNEIYDIMNRLISERTKGEVQVTFPSLEELFKN